MPLPNRHDGQLDSFVSCRALALGLRGPAGSTLASVSAEAGAIGARFETELGNGLPGGIPRWA